MERGECSTPASDPSINYDHIWAKLVPSSSQYSDIELMSSEMLLCSEINISSSAKTQWCKVTRNMDRVSATIQNMSFVRRDPFAVVSVKRVSGKYFKSYEFLHKKIVLRVNENEIIVDEMVVPADDTAVIRCGSEIIPCSNSEGKGLLSYTFKVMPTAEPFKRQLKIFLDPEHAKCCICLNVWHDVVTVAPCLHNFCNGCFSEWLRRSQEKHSSVLCPQCRAVVQFVGRNHFLHSIEEDVLKADDSLKRSIEETAVLDSYASIKSPLVISTGKKTRRKRLRSPPEDESSVELPCPQCGAEFAGYRCNQSTVHLQCHSCGGMMPSRMSIAVPQHCLGCDRAFCGAYWDAQGVTRGDSHPMCSPETFKPIIERTTTRMPFWVHEKNRHEQDITESCIRHMGRSLQGVISEWLTKMNNREIDRTRMPLNHAEMITAHTHTCTDCYDKLVSFLLYWFRITMPKHFLPPEASQREDCWYGYACRTQHHNEEHARKRNHVCRSTRGSHM